MRLNMRNRVILLAATYIDARELGKGDTGAGRAPAFGVKEPRRVEWWDEGSYWEFESATDTLRRASSSRYVWFWRVYVDGTAQLAAIAPHKRHRAEQALTFVVEATKKLGGGNIYVPLEVSENAGYTESEAKAARKPRARRAA